MTTEQFLQGLLTGQELTPDQENALQAHKTEVTAYLRTEFGQSPVIKYAGSREKGTLIADKYDLDVVCYFPSSDTRSLKDIRQDVSTHLRKKYVIEPKASAERILNLKGASAPIDYHVDVVPGRFIEQSKDVFLHVAYGEKERMQTNLKVHIDHIVNSGCVPVIRLAKLWAQRNHLSIKTFVLELFVVRTLSGSQSKSNLTKSFRQLLEALRDDFGQVKLVDPANTNNIVSQLVDSSTKALVSLAAKSALEAAGDSDQLEGWQAVFREARSAPAIITKGPNAGFVPHAPHAW
jgi:hypothetical protein